MYPQTKHITGTMKEMTATIATISTLREDFDALSVGEGGGGGTGGGGGDGSAGGGSAGGGAGKITLTATGVSLFSLPPSPSCP